MGRADYRHGARPSLTPLVLHPPLILDSFSIPYISADSSHPLELVPALPPPYLQQAARSPPRRSTDTGSLLQSQVMRPQRAAGAAERGTAGSR